VGCRETLQASKVTSKIIPTRSDTSVVDFPMSGSSTTNPLADVEALTFDVFGTVVDWLGSISRELECYAKAKGYTQPVDWVAFTKEWRSGYIYHTLRISGGGEGPLLIDELHRQIVDDMLASSQWSHLSTVFPEEERKQLTDFWHRLDGWPDSSPGLYKLKKHFIVATLSNGNVRLLVDMAKNADLPWDVVFSGQLLGSYKPNPKMYLGAAEHLSIPPNKVAMVASHVKDLRAAASYGLKTVYLRRIFEYDLEGKVIEEDESRVHEEFDVVVDSLLELVQIVEGTK